MKLSFPQKRKKKKEKLTELITGCQFLQWVFGYFFVLFDKVSC